MLDNILIVEDLEDSRFFLRAILETGKYTVTEAQNGKDALTLFQETPFDLILTDIRMPEMDGLSLLRHIKRSSPQTPVIIISAYRESENVIEALRNGACDYITKPYESEDIFASIGRVARLLEDESTEQAFSGCLASESKQYIFENDPELTNAMARFLCRDLDKAGLHAEKQLLQVSLIEAINNAMFHGNLEVSSGLKKQEGIDGFNVYDQLARQRMSESPYMDRQLIVDYSLDKKKVVFTIQDDGKGFDYHRLPDPMDPENFQNLSGRGLLMIRTFCDEVTWNDAGNQISLVKYREQERPETS